MTLLEALMSRLKIEEGTGPLSDDGRMLPYADTKGILTIGYGRNLVHRGLSRLEADYLLANDVMQAVHELQLALPFWADLNDARRLVLADLLFNTRLGNVKGFVSEFGPTLDLIGLGKYVEAATHMRSWAWFRQVGPHRAEPLAKMMEFGVLE